MMGLSLWQPWASLIAFGLKHVETRSWSTGYRGPLAILAARTTTGLERAPAELQLELCRVAGLRGTSELPLGGVVAVADLADCYVMTPRAVELCRDVAPTEYLAGDWRPGRFELHLANVRRFQAPVPARGRQGLFRLRRDEVDAVKSAIGAAVPA